VAVKSAARKPAPKPTAAKSGGSSYAQLGAFSSRASAGSEWQRLRGKAGSLLSALKPHYVAAKVNGKTVYRLQVAMASTAKAVALCSALKQRSLACVVP
jgi:hypothetical protein